MNGIPTHELEHALKEIHCAAIAGLPEIHLDRDFWVRGGVIGLKDWIWACGRLRRLGYGVEFTSSTACLNSHRLFTRVTLRPWETIAK